MIPGDDEKKGVFTDIMKNSQGILSQVPTDDEIRELLKGKTAEEKKLLLKEIEKARQAKIHMTYLMEQQKLKNDERWAVRNVEERQAILSLYNNNAQVPENLNNNNKQSQLEVESNYDGQQYISEEVEENKDYTEEPT